MTPDALRAAIEADRVRWLDHVPTCIHDTTGRGQCADCDPHMSAAAAVAALWPQGEAAQPDAVEQRPRPCGDRGCTEPSYRCDGCGAEGCDYGLRKACRCEDGPDPSPLYDDAPAQPDALDADDARGIIAQAAAALVAHGGTAAPLDVVAMGLPECVLNLALRAERVTAERDEARRRLDAVANAMHGPPPDGLPHDTQGLAAEVAAWRRNCDTLSAAYTDPRGEIARLTAEVERLRAHLAAPVGFGDIFADAPVEDDTDAAQLAALSGEAFAEEFPYAAGAIMGGVAHKSEASGRG